MDQQQILDVEPVGQPVDGRGKRILSETLFAERREVVILHNARDYPLRPTQTANILLPAHPAPRCARLPPCRDALSRRPTFCLPPPRRPCPPGKLPKQNAQTKF